MAAAPPTFIKQDQLLDEQPDLLLLTDLQGRLVFANLVARQLWQLKTRNLRSHSVWSLLQCENFNANLLLELTSRMGAGDQLRLKMTAPKGNRWRELPLDTRISSFVSDQQPLLLFSCRPLPEGRTELEQRSLDSPSNPNLGEVFNNLRDYFLRIDHRGAILMASPNLSPALGLKDNDQLRSYSLRRFINDDQWQLLQEVINGQEGYCEELTIELITTTGETLFLAFSGSTWHHADNQPGGLEGTLRNITDRHHWQRQLEDSETRYRTLFSQANDAVFLIRNLIVVDLNQQALDMFMASRETMLGARVGALSPALQPGNRQSHELIEQMFNTVSSGKSLRFEWRSLRSNGSPIDLEISLSSIRLADGEYVLAIMRDITRRLANQAALSTSEHLYNTIVNNSGDGIIIVTRDQKIVFANQRIEVITGFSQQQIVGRNFFSFFHLENPEQSQKRFTDLFENKQSLRLERNIKIANGETVLMDIKSTLGQYNAEPAMVAFFRDVTTQHLAAEELRVHRDQLEELVTQKTDHLVHALDLAETANRAKSRFLANISHELRTPLHAVLSYAEFGESKALDSEPANLKRYFNRIHSSGKRLLLLLNNLLDLSQLEAGQLVLRQEQSNIQLLVEKVIDDLQLKIGDHPITINTTSLQRTPIVTCDFDRVCQVVSQLILNALQFSADDAPIEISLSQDAKQTLVLVRDHGVGLVETEITSLFTPFTESSRTRSEAGGTGLGLAISKQIIDMHNGTINGFNNRDGGATFYFTLPNQVESSTPE